MAAEITVDASRFLKKMERAIYAVEDGALEGIQNATKGALRSARRAMEVSGTYGSAKRYAGEYLPFKGPGISGEGRIDTGEMFYSLEEEVDIVGTTVTGRVGWLNNFEEYFQYQEEGFSYETTSFPISGKPHEVKGMFILKDAQTLLNKIAPGLVSQAVKRHVKKVS